VSRFVAGFLTASAAWGLGLALWVSGVVGGETAGGEEPAIAETEVVEPPDDGEPRRRRRARPRSGTGAPTGNATTGDELGEDDPRQLDLAGSGGEAQLPRSAIEDGMDGAFSRIRRCLVLAAGDDPVTGRLVFGLRIEPDGQVSRVNLTGPAVVTTGDAGDCLRAAARAIHFPSFDGPPMVVRYPITLD
jgi:hypothetical protein